MELLNPIDLGVNPHRLLGYLESLIQHGRIVDATAWNQAVEACTPAPTDD